jgi:ADP-heptose:LPS heptosyltransferase
MQPGGEGQSRCSAPGGRASRRRAAFRRLSGVGLGDEAMDYGKLHHHYGRVLLCGGPDDTPTARVVHERSGQCSVNLVGRADLQTFMALVDRARLVISNDSAPMHVAVARNVPVVAVFCATTPDLGYAPYSDRAVVVEKKNLFCRPCSRHGGPSCPRGTEDCMRQVTVADVLAGVDTLLANTGTQARPVSLRVHG